MEKSMLPKLLGIGAQKAGTSWLHTTFGQHPDMWVPPFKELHFFDHKFVPENRRWTEWHIRKNVGQTRESWEQQGSLTAERIEYLDKIMERPMFNGQWYKHIFSMCPDGKIGFDVTPEYCQIPEDGIEFVKRFLGKDTKVIYVVRNPVDRAISQLKMNVSRKKLSHITIAEWLKLADDPVIDARGDYQKYIPLWMKGFSKEAVHFAPFGLLHKHPATFLASLEKFVGISKHTYTNPQKRVFASPDVEIPSEVVIFLSKKLSAQEDYLKNTFGYDFFTTC